MSGMNWKKCALKKLTAILLTPLMLMLFYTGEGTAYTKDDNFDAVRIEVFPVRNSTTNSWDVKIRLINTSPSETLTKGKVAVEAPVTAAGTYDFPAVAPNSSYDVVIPAVPITSARLEEFQFIVKTENGAVKSLTRKISALTAVRAGKVVVDGILDQEEWKGAAEFNFILNEAEQLRRRGLMLWSGKSDLNAVGKVKWDDEYLYVAVNVTDDIHLMEEPSFYDAWAGDSIQLSIDPGRAAGYNSIGHHRLILAHNSLTGESKIVVDGTDISGLKKNLLKKSLIKVIRDEATKQTNYEAAIKWSEILPPEKLPVKAGETDIGFSVLVNDADTPDLNEWDLRETLIEYMSGIGYGKTPAAFGDLILTEETELVESPLAELHGRQLPELLKLEDGTTVNSPELWEARKKEILQVLSSEIYGFSPDAPENVRATVISTDAVANGKGICTKYRLSFFTPKGKFSFPFSLILPKNKTNVPVFLHLSFGYEEEPDTIKHLLNNGFGIATIYYEDIAEDRSDLFEPTGIAKLYGQGERKPNEWGKIGMWAFGASRVLDYLETIESVDAKHVAVMGWSRLGKAALWAGAMDERFYLTISNNSGAGGAAINRDKKGETIQDLNNTFYFWFCENYLKYNNKEDSAPFDQHFLLAAIAPRLLYVASATGDDWADPKSEFLGAFAADDAYRVLGQKGLVTGDRFPAGGDVLHEGSIGYHLRIGDHDLTAYDWQQFVSYFKKHLKSSAK